VQSPRTKTCIRHAVENLNQADALLFGRVTYEMMESAWRRRRRRKRDLIGMDNPSPRTINAVKKYVVSRTLERVDWNAGIW